MTPETVGAVLVALFSGGLFNQLLNMRRTKVETGRILIDSAGEVVVLQKALLLDLQAHVADVEDRLNQALEELHLVTLENVALKARIEVLEAQGGR